MFNRLNLFVTILAAAALNAGTTASATERDCAPGAPFSGAPTREPLDMSNMPTRRAITFDPMPAPNAAQLDDTFDALLAKTEASAASMAIWKPGLGYWSRTTGIAHNQTDRFWWASVGKLATSTVTLQLIAEGKLSEASTVASFFPTFKRASTATVGDLLRHTSGIFSFNADLKFQKKSGYRTPSELMAVADKHPLDFCPGTNWNYSNTGYIMLARIAEQVDGEPFAKIVERRIAKPFHLSSFTALQPENPENGVVPLASGRGDEVTTIAIVYGAGGIVSNSQDMLAFLHAYLELGLLSFASKQGAMAVLHPMFGTTMHYGAGIMVTDVPDPDQPTIWVGHSGGTPDAKGLVLYDVERDAYVAIALNNQAPAEAIANAALKALD